MRVFDLSAWASYFGNLTIKQLGMRLGLATGLAASGGGGIYYMQSGGNDDVAAVQVAEQTKSPESKLPRPIPLPVSDLGSNTTMGSDELPSSQVVPASDNAPLSRYDAAYADDAPVRPSTQYANSTEASETDSSPYQQAQPREDGTQADAYVPFDDYGSGSDSYASPYASRYGDQSGSSAAQEPAELESTEPLADADEVGTTAGGYGVSLSDEIPPSSHAAGDSNPEMEGSPSDIASDPPPRPSVSSPQITEDTYSPATTSTSLGEPAPTASSSASSLPDPRSTAADYGVASSSAAPSPSTEIVGNPRMNSSYSTPIGAATSVPVAAAASSLASSSPGPRQIEGAQTPTLMLEKKAPAEVSVGQPATFEIAVRNVGNVIAHGVTVTDHVPQGAELVDSSPAANPVADGLLAWQLGDLEPGEQATISVKLIPLVEGEIGSVAQVTFNAQASARTVSTKPGLAISHTGPERVLIGQDVVFDITLSNPGSGVTTGVVLEEDVPEGLVHVAGKELEYEVGTLRPKEEKRLQLILKADQAGTVQNLLRVRADGGLEVTDQATVEVTSPQLQVNIIGPKARYLERQATYEIAIANPGTAAGYDIQLVAFLPKGLRFVSADNKGRYDEQGHSVAWSLPELPAQQMGSVHVTALPIETGEQKLRVEAHGNLGTSAKFEHITAVEGLTELVFSVQDTHDPIEVGSDTVYEIRIGNNGNKVATNVQIVALMGDDIKPLNGEGPSRVTIEGQQVSMAPIDKIAPREEVVYRVTAKGTRAGDHVIAVQLSSDEVPKPVVKQESTKVYADQ